MRSDREARRLRLAAVTSHPVQYQAPLFQQLAAQKDIELTVFYGHDASIVGDMDPDFGRPVAWDRPLLDGYRSLVLKRRGTPNTRRERLLADLRIIGELWRGRFDAVLIHSYATRLSVLAYFAAFTRGTPVLLRTESERLQQRRWWVDALKCVVLKPLFAATSGFLVIGSANRRFFEHYGVAASRQFFTPYCVDNEFFSRQREALAPSRETLRHRLGIPDDVVMIGFSGKLIARKGVEDLLAAVTRLQGERLRVGALIIGDGPDRDRLEATVRANRLEWIVFAGFKNQTELASCFICMDLFTLPSRFDPWGLVVNEAMLFELPAVASTRVGAALDLIEDGENGFVVEVGNVDALAGAFRQLVRSPAMRKAFGARSLERVQRYSYAVCVDGIRTALRHVARQPRHVSAAVPESVEQ